MARLQDFPSVTPTSSDKLLVVQSQGQGLVPYGSKLDSANPTGTGALSMNRKANTTVGTNSVAVGLTAEASGNYSVASGTNTVASGERSFAAGNNTIANHFGQYAFGSCNVADPSTAAATSRGNYIEIVGNSINANARSNARTLDWSGNEVLAGGLTLGGHSSVIGTIELGTNASSVAVPDSSITEMGSITLSAGAWIILACADWAKNANGYRQIAFGVGVDPVRHGAVTTLSAGADKETYQQIMQFSTFNAQTTQKVYVMQNSGSALNVFPYIYAIRIA